MSTHRQSPPPFFSDCVRWPKDQVDLLCWLQDQARDISAATFKRRIGAEAYGALERNLGYDTSRHSTLRLKDDWAVGFHSVPGTGVVYCCHSAIEYVFAEPAEIDRLAEQLAEADRALDDPSDLDEDPERVEMAEPAESLHARLHDWRRDKGVAAMVEVDPQTSSARSTSDATTAAGDSAAAPTPIERTERAMRLLEQLVPTPPATEPGDEAEPPAPAP